MLRRGEVGCRALNDHGNYIVDHGKIMEKSWNFVFEFLWEPCRVEHDRRGGGKSRSYHAFLNALKHHNLLSALRLGSDQPFQRSQLFCLWGGIQGACLIIHPHYNFAMGRGLGQLGCVY